MGAHPQSERGKERVIRSPPGPGGGRAGYSGDAVSSGPGRGTWELLGRREGCPRAGPPSQPGLSAQLSLCCLCGCRVALTASLALSSRPAPPSGCRAGEGPDGPRTAGRPTTPLGPGEVSSGASGHSMAGTKDLAAGAWGGSCSLLTFAGWGFQWRPGCSVYSGGTRPRGGLCGRDTADLPRLPLGRHVQPHLHPAPRLARGRTSLTRAPYSEAGRGLLERTRLPGVEGNHVARSSRRRQGPRQTLHLHPRGLTTPFPESAAGARWALPVAPWRRGSGRSHPSTRRSTPPRTARAPGPSGCLPASAARPRAGAGCESCASAPGERSCGRGFWGSVWASVPRGTVSPSQSSCRGGPGRGLPAGGCVPLQQDPLGSCRGGHRGTGAAPAPTTSAGGPAPGSSGERLSRAS